MMDLRTLRLLNRMHAVALLDPDLRRRYYLAIKRAVEEVADMPRDERRVQRCLELQVKYFYEQGEEA